MMTGKRKNNPKNSSGNPQIDPLLRGGGEMGALICSIDWSGTPLGNMETWPPSLVSALKLCLHSKFPALVWWGKELVQMYNDAYRPMLGRTKHPAAMGQRASETWKEAWDILGPLAESVFLKGEATWSDDQFLPIERYGFTEETYWTFSYSPIFDESDNVGGIFISVTETTKRVLSERRLRTLRDLGAHASEGKSAEEACRIAAEELEKNPLDIPFALLYLLDQQRQQANLVGSAGIDPTSGLYIQRIDLADESDSVWPLTQVLQAGQIVVDEQFSTRFPALPSSSSHTALILPIAASGYTHTTGFLVCGVSPRLILNEDYRHFYELLMQHIATAVTNARAYQDERKRAEALAELDRAKTEFFSNVSHEFRTPLTLMLNPLQELLANDDTLTPQQRESLDVLQRNSLRLLKLVNTLLDFSRIQSNRIQGSFEPTDLAALTVDLASNFRSVIEQAGLRLKVECPPLPEPVYVDQDMWEKIVLNLLSNAFKFTFTGEICVTLQATSHTVELKVQDTGVGISQHHIPHIFERFFRVQGVRSRTFEGSGIGLALVAELVRFHGGQIEVTSAPDVGTTFTVSIPLGITHLPQDQINAPRTLHSTAVGAASYTEEALRWTVDDAREETPRQVSRDKTPEGGRSRSQRTSGERILIADDNADMRDYLVRLLEPRYQVEAVPDGSVALEKIQQQAPTLVISDVMMPSLDGFGLLQKLRSTDRTRTLPVILLSARAGEDARIEGLQAGADDYLVKPFSARELLARVDAQLQLAQLRREADARLNAEQQRIINIFESISDAFTALDKEYRYTYLNPQGVKLTSQLSGKTEAELVGRTVWEIFPGSFDSPFGEAYRKVMQDGKPVQFQAFFPPLDSWFEVRVYPSKEGLSVYFADITEQQQIQMALRRTQARLASALEAGLAGTFFWDVRQDRITTDEKLQQYFSLSEQALHEGVPLAEVLPAVHEADRPRVAQALRTALEQTGVYQMDYRVHHSDGSVRWLSARGTVERDEHGTVLGLPGFAVDITQLKEVERALRESETRFRAFVTASSEVVYRMSADWREMRHLEGRDFIADTESPNSSWIAKYIHPEDQTQVLSVINEAIRTKSLFQLEHRVLRVDGTRGWTFSRAVPLLDEQGEIVEWFGTASDITERKQIEEALREAKERFQVAQRAGNVGVWDWDGITGMTYWSEVMWQLHGVEPQPLTRKDDLWNSLIHPADRLRVEARIAAALASDMDYRDEFRIIRPDGAVRWIESVGQVIRDASNVAVRMSGVNLDISERKRVEEALRQAQEWQRLIIDSAKDYAIFTLDLQGRVTTWNTGAERLFGYTEADIIGMDGAVVYTPEDRIEDIPRREMQRATELGYAENERWHLRKDGRRFFASGMVRPIRDETETLVGYTKIAQDTTERKLAEARTELLQHLASELSAKTTQQDMAATIIQAVHQAIGTSITSVFWLSPDGLALQRLSTEGMSEARQQEFNNLPLTGAFPATDAVRSGQRIWFASQQEYLQHYPHLEEPIVQLDIHAASVIPLTLDGQHLGCVSISFHQSRLFSTQEQEHLIAIANLCAQALQRAHLFEREQQARNAASRRAERITRLQTVTAKLSQPLTFDEVAQLMVDEAAAALGATTGSFNLLEDHNTFAIVYSLGSKMSVEERKNWLRYPFDPNLLAGDTVQRGELIWIENSHDLVKRYPTMQRIAEIYPGAWISVPLVVEGGVIGLLAFAFGEDKSFDQELHDFVIALAQQCAQAVERAWLYESEQQARISLEQTANRIIRLQGLTAGLSEAVTLQQVAHVCVTQSLSAIGAHIGDVVLITEDGEWLETVAHQGTPAEAAEYFKRLPLGLHSPLAEVVRTGQPIWIPSLEAFQQQYPLLAAETAVMLESEAFANLPLNIEGRTIGGIGFAFPSRQAFEASDRAFMLALAQQCAQAIQRARLYEDEAFARQKAEEANVLKMQFLGMISHELRTPLASIKGFASTLLAKDVTFAPEKQHRFIEIINVESDKLIDLVEQLLDLSRLQAGSLRIEPVSQPFEQILQTSLAQLHTLTAQHQLILNIPGTLPLVLADTQRIAQVLVNLVANAAKFSPPGSEITLEVTQIHQHLQVNVSDQGVGIPPEERERVFEAFRQIERKTLNQRLGAGLGLAICKGIVEAHGGKIWIQAQEVGTMLSFLLPVVETQN